MEVIFGKGSGIYAGGAFSYETQGGYTCALSQQSALECTATTLVNSRTRANTILNLLDQGFEEFLITLMV